MTSYMGLFLLFLSSHFMMETRNNSKICMEMLINIEQKIDKLNERFNELEKQGEDDASRNLPKT